ncbi:unnamed protein product [Phaedon cochleariae]|uniref:Aminopeptidase n=1 Tax=Phaedon cochleariae TaxID=80249 RepID=A0A9N9X2L4_PHACE|nr:unnamed protein product [Phaedon cochleariae]
MPKYKDILPLLLLFSPALAAENYRLPTDIKPTHYKLHLEANPEESIYSGQVEITLEVSKKNQSELSLHAHSSLITISDIKYDGNISCSTSSASNVTDIISISCPTPLASGKTLNITFMGTFATQDMSGFYKSTYDDKQVLVATQFEPIYARRAFPCFDEPGFKATFDISITHPVAYNVLANTPAVPEKTTISGSEKTTVFRTTPKMSTYLVAFIVSHFEPALKSPGKYNVYARPSASHTMGLSTKYGEYLVDSMGKWMGISYTDLGDPQVAQVAIPDFAAGAMENWGLITFREVDLLDEGDKTSNSARQRVMTTMAHEIAHQWFGDYVTLDWWSDTWLNEGFATYFQYYLANSVDNGTMELDKQFVLETFQPILEEDCLPSSLPLSSPEKEINSLVEINNKFDGISYSKGGSIVRMMQFILGDTIFQKGLNSYLSANKYSNTSPSILLKYLQNAAGKNVPDFQNKMKNWIHTAGFPLLTVTQSDDKTVNVTQTIFNRNDTTQWFVPISYTNSSEKDFSVKIKGWLEPNKPFQIPHKSSEWLIINLQASGFYRVNYDSQLWDNIIKALKGKDKDSIDSLNRAQLINDIFNIAKVGQIDYEKAFALVQYLKDETDYYAWDSALTAFEYLLGKLDEKTEKLLKSMILDLLNSAFPSTTEYVTHIDKLKENLISSWACNLNQEQCISDAKKSFQEYKTNSSSLDNNLRDVVLCYGLKNSEKVTDDYNFLLNVFEKSTSPVEQHAILVALGCIEDEEVLLEYLSLTINKTSSIRQQDYSTLFSSVYYKSKKGLNVALSFLEDNFDKIEESYGGVNEISGLITGLADKLTTDSQIEKASIKRSAIA